MDKGRTLGMYFLPKATSSLSAPGCSVASMAVARVYPPAEIYALGEARSDDQILRRKSFDYWFQGEYHDVVQPYSLATHISLLHFPIRRAVYSGLDNVEIRHRRVPLDQLLDEIRERRLRVRHAHTCHMVSTLRRIRRTVARLTTCLSPGT